MALFRSRSGVSPRFGSQRVLGMFYCNAQVVCVAAGEVAATVGSLQHCTNLSSAIQVWV